MTNKYVFHPLGITIKTQEGEVVLNAGNGITIFPAGNIITWSANIPANIIANGNGIPWQPPSMSNGIAPNNSIYFSIDVNKLVYKDASAVVNNLY